MPAPPKLDQDTRRQEREQHHFRNELGARFGGWSINVIAKDTRRRDESDNRGNKAEPGNEPSRVEKREQRERCKSKKARMSVTAAGEFSAMPEPAAT